VAGDVGDVLEPHAGEIAKDDAAAAQSRATAWDSATGAAKDHQEEALYDALYGEASPSGVAAAQAYLPPGY
jgi:hypothetical protein